MILGEVETADKDKVEGVWHVGISADVCEANGYNLNPDCTKQYSQCLCELGGDYTVTPSKTNNVLCGVTTFDLVLISKHILGLELLDSPYKIIAADANNSNSVTTADLVAIRKLILLIDETFPDAPSWRFVDANFTFVNPANPFAPPFPTVFNCQNTSGPCEANFVAIKVGDVNLNCTKNGDCTGFTGNLLEERGLPEQTFSIPALQGKQGEIITIPFIYQGKEPLFAFQTGIQFDLGTLELIGPSKADLEYYGKDHFGLTQVDKGYIRSLWHSPDEEYGVITAGKALFNLTFRVKKDFNDISKVISLDDKVLANLAFNKAGDEFHLILSTSKEEPIESPDTGKTLLKAASQPNPFSHELNLNIEAAKPGTGNLMIFDGFGVRYFAKEVAFTEGNNLVVVPGGNLPAGVLVWKLLTPYGKLTGTAVKQ
jgi:hypothetical protein